MEFKTLSKAEQLSGFVELHNNPFMGMLYQALEMESQHILNQLLNDENNFDSAIRAKNCLGEIRGLRAARNNIIATIEKLKLEVLAESAVNSSAPIIAGDSEPIGLEEQI